jgi:hypothetical protein
MDPNEFINDAEIQETLGTTITKVNAPKAMTA